MKGPGFFKQTASMDNVGSYAPIESDNEGILSATISADSGQDQIVAASSGSTISTANVTFPAGALALNTTVTIEEGASLASAAFTSELGDSSDVQVQSAGAAVAVTSSVPMDAASPFTLAIPVTSSSGLRLTADDMSLIVVIYKVYKAAEGKVVVGIIPNSELTIVNGIVSFDTSHFGVYQAALADRPVEKAVQAETQAPILTKAEETKLADVVWKPLVVSYTASTRKLAVTGAADNLTPSSCAAFYDLDKTEPFEHVEDTAAKLAISIVVPDDANGTVFIALECVDQNGRVTRSAWSDGVAIKAVPKDSAPPAIAALLPAANAVGVPRTGAVSVTFNEAISQAIPAGALTLKNLQSKQMVQGSVTPFNQGVKFAPYEPLGIRASYQVLGAAGIRDLFGNAAPAYGWTFRTGEGTWRAPQLDWEDSSTSPGAYQAQTAMSGNGHALAVYAFSGDQYGLNASYFKDGLWSGGVHFSNDNMNISVPVLDNAGAGFVFWRENVYANSVWTYYLKALRVNADGTFANTVDVAVVDDGNGTPDDSLFDFSAASIGGSNFITLWRQSRDGVESLRSRLFVNGAWQAPSTVPGASYYSGTLQLAGNNTGKAVATWSNGGGSPGLFGAYFNGSAWTNGQKINSSADNLVANTPLINDGGVARVIYREFPPSDPSESYLRSRVISSGTGWAAPETLEALVGPDSLVSFQAAEGGDGSILATWVVYLDGNGYAINARRFTTNWSPKQEIVGGFSNVPDYAVANSAAGRAALIFSGVAAPSGLSASYYNGSSWSAATSLYATGENMITKQLTIDDAGNASAFWIERTTSGNGDSFHLKSARFGADTTGWAAPVNLKSVLEDDGVYGNCMLYMNAASNRGGEILLHTIEMDDGVFRVGGRSFR
jgi:hypothetical protein